MRPRKATFSISAAKPAGFPPPELPEVAFAGRSNVGKSTLINALTGVRGLARTSNTPGRTQLLNWFDIAIADRRIAFVDLPGYGYARVSRETRKSWRSLIEAYLSDRPVLRAVVLLIDARRGAESEEQELIDWLGRRDIPVLAVLTKIDKLSRAHRKPAGMALRQELGLRRAPLLVSGQSGEGLDELWRAILKLVPREARPA
jgi:GTP-binding protein